MLTDAERKKAEELGEKQALEEKKRQAKEAREAAKQSPAATAKQCIAGITNLLTQLEVCIAEWKACTKIPTELHTVYQQSLALQAEELRNLRGKIETAMTDGTTAGLDDAQAVVDKSRHEMGTTKTLKKRYEKDHAA